MNKINSLLKFNNVVCYFSAEQQLTQELQSLPVRTDTLRVRTRKEEIERKLSEVEEAVKIFSRPKVFVKS